MTALVTTNAQYNRKAVRDVSLGVEAGPIVTLPGFDPLQPRRFATADVFSLTVRNDRR